jgi:hypothetical protein
LKKTALITIIVLVAMIVMLVIQVFQTKYELKKQTLIVNELVEKSNKLEEEIRLNAEIKELQKIYLEQTIDSLKMKLDNK